MVEKAKIVYENYIKRFFIHPFSKTVDLPDAGIFVVIPSYAEEDLELTLKSLAECGPNGIVCILVVLNDKINDPEEFKEINRQAVSLISDFNLQYPQLIWKSISAVNLDDKNAGVGLTRKIGLDAVILHLAHTGKNPALVCLDADSIVAPDYLQRIYAEFHQSTADVAILEFEHKTELTNIDLINGILQYELFLEYYRLGLCFAGYPHFYHTVGSSMACKALPYAQSGGMNQRLAGEDFYFLHKLFPHFETVQLKGPLVFPSPRISTRVPFGTGRFQQKWIEKNEDKLLTYQPAVFKLLKLFLRACTSFIEVNELEFNANFTDFREKHPTTEIVLKEFEVQKNLESVRNSSPKILQRQKALYRWFDGLKVLRFIHAFSEDFPFVATEQSLSVLLPEIEFSDDIRSVVQQIRRHLYEIPVQTNA